MRERELKLGVGSRIIPALASLPMRERELKPGRCGAQKTLVGRAPCGSVN